MMSLFAQMKSEMGLLYDLASGSAHMGEVSGWEGFTSLAQRYTSLMKDKVLNPSVCSGSLYRHHARMRGSFL